MCALLGLLLVTTDVTAAELQKIRYEFTYSAQVTDLPPDASSIDLWIPVPSDTDGQEVTDVRVASPGDGTIGTEPQYQNRMFHRRFAGPFSASSDVSAELVFQVVRTEIHIPEAKQLAATKQLSAVLPHDVYLRPNRLIPIDGKVQEIALSLQLPKDPLRTGRRLYDYLLERMTYNWKAEGAGRGDVLWACDSRTGDCTDYHSMFIALCRSQGIPADHEFGFPIRTDESSGKLAHYHCWARFFVKGVGWVPVDISEADKHPELKEYNFGSLSAKLLKLTHGRDVTLVPPQAAEPLNTFIYPYVEVDGQPLEKEKVTWTMTFQELSKE
jgi:transglutaminase-like putative cysteine protease